MRNLTPILFAILAVATFFALSRSGEPSRFEEASSAGTRDSSQGVTLLGESAAGVQPRLAVQSLAPSILVLNQDRTPITDAKLRNYRESVIGTMETTESALANSGSDGLLSHASLREDGARFLITHDDYVPAVVGGGIEGQVVVELTKSSKLTVTVISDHGATLPGVLLMMSPRVEGSLAVLPSRSDGAPLHARPTWTRTTDATGRATFDSAPNGLYCVGAFHEFYAPLLFEPGFVRLDRDTDITFTMQDMYGAVFVIPEPGAVNKMEWDWNLAGTDQSYGSVSRNAYCRERLMERFPDAHVFVRRPNPRLIDQGQTLDVGLRVILEDGTAWSGRCPLTPIRELRDPVFLKQDQNTKLRHLRVEIRTPSGRLLETPLQFVRTDEVRRSPVVEVVPHGSAQFLAYGSYLVAPANAPAWLSESSKDLEFVVAADQPAGDVVHLTVAKEFVPITIVPKPPAGTLLSPLHMVIDDIKKEGMVIANWEPSRGPISLLAPAGSLTIVTRSQCYEDIDLEVNVVEHLPMEPIILHLIERPSISSGK
jgi:hypothetical protein